MIQVKCLIDIKTSNGNVNSGQIGQTEELFLKQKNRFFVPVCFTSITDGVTCTGNAYHPPVLMARNDFEIIR